MTVNDFVFYTDIAALSEALTKQDTIYYLDPFWSCPLLMNIVKFTIHKEKPELSSICIRNANNSLYSYNLSLKYHMQRFCERKEDKP